MADDAPPDVRPDEGIPEPPEPPPATALELPPVPAAPIEHRRSKAAPIAIGAAILAVIIAVVAIAVGGSKHSTGAARPSVLASIVPPSGFTAIPQSFSITLNWVAPTGETVTSYQLVRNGTFRATVDPPTTTYTDIAVAPGASYTYEILAQVGTRTSSKISVVVQTLVPALADARLDGKYRVKAKYLRETGYISFPKPFTLEWSFTPLCATGACNVRMVDLFLTQIRPTLHRSGTNYHGSDSGYFLGTCGSKRTTSSLTFSIRVVAAKASSGEWVPSKFVGTIIQNDAPEFGCVATTGTISITGTLSA